MKKLVPILFAVAAIGFSVPVVKSVITGMPLNIAFLALAFAMFVLTLVFFVVGRESNGSSGT